MIRTALVMVFLLACAGCAASQPQTAAASGCNAGASPDSQDCQSPANGQISAHLSGMVQVGVGMAR
jgi:hypothetical protein